MTELLVVEQRARGGDSSAASFILDRHGREMPGQEDDRRIAELCKGLTRHSAVRLLATGTARERLEQVLGVIHEREYLHALRALDSDEPTMMPEWAPPGLPADTPAWAEVIATAFEGMCTAIAAAERIVAGERFTYALCRPPGHHAGPAWFGGYCYLNTAAAAAYTLCDGGLAPVAILDLDFHFPTGTSAVLARMSQISLHSLHASTLENMPWRAVEPQAGRERFVDFATAPNASQYLEALAASIETLKTHAAALVLSLGYDTVAGDPHGSWDFSPDIFVDIGRLLAESKLPVCVVQEGGYALHSLAACGHAFASGLLSGDET